MEAQISMFDIIDEQYTTPLIPMEEQTEGKKGWIIEISAILLVKNGFKEDTICVCTRPVVFTATSRKDRYGRWSQYAQTTHGPHEGWCGAVKDVYRYRPTWTECERFARKKYSIPQKVAYYERDGDWNEVWTYEEGYSKGARA